MVALASQLDELHECLRERGLWVHSDGLYVRSQSINTKDRSFEAVVATEERALIFDYRSYDVIEEILVAKGGKFPSQTPLLDSHMRFMLSDQLGSARGFRRDGDVWMGQGFVGRAVPGNTNRDQVWQDIEDGHIRAVSIGYQVTNSVDIPPGKRANVNGKSYQAGERTLRVSTEWQAHELSVVCIGADSQALIRSRLGVVAPKPRRFFR